MPELRSPLAHLPLGPATREPAALTAAELPDLGYLVLRGRQDDPAFMAATAAVLGVDFEELCWRILEATVAEVRP